VWSQFARGVLGRKKKKKNTTGKREKEGKAKQIMTATQKEMKQSFISLHTFTREGPNIQTNGRGGNKKGATGEKTVGRNGMVASLEGPPVGG